MVAGVRARLSSSRLGGWGWAVLGLSLAFVALRLWLTREMEKPFIFSDELGYLFDARYLSGVDPPPEHPYLPFYTVGYPLLLAPLSWIFENPIGVYHGALVGNALLGGVTVPILYRVGREVLGLAPRDAFFAAGVVTAYPAFLLHGNIAWAENLLPPLMALHALLMYRAFTRRSLAWAIAPAVTGAWLYVTHPRTIPVVAATVLFFAIGAWRRLAPVAHSAAATAVLGALLGLGALLNNLVREAVYRGPVGGGPSKTESTSDFVVDSAAEPAVYSGALTRALGQAWYLCATSAGLWALGIGFLAALVWRSRREPTSSEERARSYWAAFLLLAIFTSFIPAALIIADTQPNTIFAVYGRYMESISPVVFMAGAAVVLVVAKRRRRLVAFAGAAVAILGLTLIVHLDSPSLDEAPVNVPTVLAALYSAGISNWTDLLGFDLYRATAVGLGGLAVLALIPRRFAPVAVVLVGAGFVWTALVTAERTIQPFGAALGDEETLQATLSTLPPGEPVGFELSSWLQTGLPQYQFQEDDRRFRIYDIRLGERPPDTQVVLAKLDDRGMRREGARVMAFEGHRNQALWIRPGPLLREYVRQGKVFPGDLNQALPRAARRSLIALAGTHTVPLRVRSGQVLPLDITLTHAGRRSPWRQPGTAPETRGNGFVSVAVSWLPANGRRFRLSATTAPLTRTLGPKATLGLRVHPVAADAKGRPFRPGRYLLEFSPIQQKRGLFADQGDAPLLVPVNVAP